MLKTKSRLLLSFFLLFPILNLFSQNDYREGYIVTIDHDTVPGFILYKESASRYTKCSFRKEMNAEAVEYYPLRIAGYGIKNDHYYKSKLVMIDSVNSHYFAEVLVQGKA